MANHAAWSVARLIRNNGVAQQILSNSSGYSPHDLLSRFGQSSTLTVKRALKQYRFFMYEEHASTKLTDEKIAQTIAASPNELAALLEESPHEKAKRDFHYYWTSPVASVAPALLKSTDFQWYKQIHNKNDDPLLDPRGPSLWMGTSGSGTQCHYDVANNIILQLHGTKRVRCFHPSVGVNNLHVFPDAHPRARKSQVDFDSNDKGGMQQKFPHFFNVPPPYLDVTLKPGDILEIPAFWFHHVENGRIPNNNEPFEGDDGPSVSLNSFALSKHMMIAQQIFQKASRPLGRHTPSNKIEVAPAALKALGTTLIRELKVVDVGMEEEFIRHQLLDARYVPLKNDNKKMASDNMTRALHPLTDEQLSAVGSCVEKIIPDFQHLLMDGEESGKAGIALLVGLHLLELWAVEFAGPHHVAQVWDEALSGTIITKLII